MLEPLLAHNVVAKQDEYAKVMGPPELIEIDGWLSGFMFTSHRDSHREDVHL
jgi:hypothetical protein